MMLLDSANTKDRERNAVTVMIINAFVWLYQMKHTRFWLPRAQVLWLFLVYSGITCSSAIWCKYFHHNFLNTGISFPDFITRFPETRYVFCFNCNGILIKRYIEGHVDLFSGIWCKCRHVSPLVLPGSRLNNNLNIYFIITRKWTCY